MTYATTEEVTTYIGRTLREGEEEACSMLLEEAAAIIDAYNSGALTENKKLVSLRMSKRALNLDSSFPIGATQGSMSAMGYSQQWGFSSGSSSGQLYLDKTDKILLGRHGAAGSYSPVEELAEVSK